MAERIYRDPVHNIIDLDDAREDDRLLVSLIDAPEFQRLRRIKQLGLALYTYPGAEHSRFVHSLGVMHLMSRALDRMRRHYELEDRSCAVARCAALLHDIGHGPFSHAIEAVLGLRHETWSVAIINDPGTVIHQVLSRVDSRFPADVAAAIDHDFSPRCLSQLVSSQLDVDRFDYLLRDSLMTGAQYGKFDLEWVLHALEIDPERDRIYVTAKGMYAVEEYLQSRYYMFRQVYFHRSLRSAEVLLKRILGRAAELACKGQLSFSGESTVLATILAGRPPTLPDYLQLDDHDVMYAIKQWTGDPDPVLSDLSRRFLTRRMFKTMELPDDRAAREECIALVKGVVEKAGFDPAFYIGEDRASDSPYGGGPYEPESMNPEAHILVEDEDNSGRLREISEVSAVVRGMRRYQIERICFPGEVLDEVLHRSRAGSCVD